MAIYGEVSMTYQLTSLAAGAGKAHAVSNVVQAALQLLQQDLTGYAVLTLSLFIVSVELFFQDAIDEFNFLFLIQLQAVLRLFAAHLLWIAAGLLGVTKDGRGKAQRFATLEDWLSVLCHSFGSSLITLFFSLADGIRCVGLE